jgi:hypothetical protein
MITAVVLATIFVGSLATSWWIRRSCVSALAKRLGTFLLLASVILATPVWIPLLTVFFVVAAFLEIE